MHEASNIYLDIMQLFIAPQLEKYQPWTFFQKDGTPPHWVSLVHVCLNKSHT